MHPDKLGVYRVGDLKFHSKFEAIQMHQKTGIHPHWDYNEAVYSLYDWTVEPSEDLLELYRARAQQLRDKYDYVILMHSGGADSTTTLESFVDNDIKLDEIAHLTNYSRTGEKYDYTNGELFKVAFPIVESVKERYPHIKQRMIDLPDLTMDYFKGVYSPDSWLYELNCIVNASGVARESIGLKIKEWADMIHAGKKLCIVTGTDKPRIIHHPDGRFSFRFIDIVDGSTTVKSMAGQQPYADEFFFWSPDMPEISIKQAHVVRRFLTDPNSMKSPFMSEKRSDLAFIRQDERTVWLSNHGLHRLIYPKWDIGNFTVGKPKSVIFTPRDQWINQLESTNTVRINWEHGLATWWKTLPDYWKNDVNDMSRGIKLCWSKDYFF